MRPARTARESIRGLGKGDLVAWADHPKNGSIALRICACETFCHGDRGCQDVVLYSVVGWPFPSLGVSCWRGPKKRIDSVQILHSTLSRWDEQLAHSVFVNPMKVWANMHQIYHLMHVKQSWGLKGSGHRDLVRESLSAYARGGDVPRAHIREVHTWRRFPNHSTKPEEMLWGFSNLQLDCAICRSTLAYGHL